MIDEEDTLEGQIVLVTGAAKRIGRAVAQALSDEGVGVVVPYRSSREEAEALVAELTGGGARAWAVQADLSDPSSAAGLIERASGAARAPVDILINSAGIFAPSGVLDFSADDLAANLRVNAFAPLLLSRALAAQGGTGQIVNFLDARMVENDREHAAYHLSKRMLFTLTRMLALELAPRIRVNAVAPGLILPPPGQDEPYLQRMADTVPLKRHGGPRDVVRSVLFLLKSEFITGQVIYVDGGRNLKGRMYGG